MSNVILQNVFIQRLQIDLPTGLRDSLQKSFDIPQYIDQGVERGIRLACEYMFGSTQGIRLIYADMAGLKKVFILFVPVVGVCLLLCFLVKVRLWYHRRVVTTHSDCKLGSAAGNAEKAGRRGTGGLAGRIDHQCRCSDFALRRPRVLPRRR